MSYLKIESALMKAVSEVGLTIPIQYPNQRFQVPDTGAWGQVFLIPNRPEIRTLGEGGYNIVTGLLQFTLRYPLGVGTAPYRSDFSLIAAKFKTGYLTHDGQAVLVLTTGQEPIFFSDKYLVGVVSIQWESRIKRPI